VEGSCEHGNELGYGLDGQGIVVRFPTGLRDFRSSPQLENRLYVPPDFYIGGCLIKSRDSFTFDLYNYELTLFIHSTMALQPFVEPWPLIQFRNHFYTDSRTPWTSDQPVARPPPTHRTTQTQNKRAHRHPCP
jgi:hypothetical protein